MDTSSILNTPEVQHSHTTSLNFQVAGPDMIFAPLQTNDSILLARQVLQLSGRKPVNDYLIFLWPEGGELKELQLDDSVDLREQGVERFIVFRSDRSYRLVLEDVRIEWGSSQISGRSLKLLAGVDPDEFAVLLDMTHSADREIGNDEFADLSGDGAERFKIELKPIRVEVNDMPVILDKKETNGLRIKEQAIAQHVSIQIGFQLIVERPGQPSKVVGDDEKIRVKTGMKFRAIPADDNS